MIVTLKVDNDRILIADHKAAIVGVFNIDGSHGTGFYIKYNNRLVVITNDHVCAHALKDGAMLSDPATSMGPVSTVIKSTPSMDLCALAPASNQGSYLELGSDPDEGDYVMAYGLPFDFGLTPSFGHILSEETVALPMTPTNQVSFHLYRTSITAFPGNSGSPLLNRRGYVVGVVNSISFRTNYAYAITGATLKSFLDSLQ